MTPEQRRDILIRAGETFAGAYWKGTMARNLGVDRRTVSRWYSGANEVPEWVMGDLRALLEPKAEALSGLLREIDRAQG